MPVCLHVIITGLEHYFTSLSPSSLKTNKWQHTLVYILGIYLDNLF